MKQLGNVQRIAVVLGGSQPRNLDHLGDLEPLEAFVNESLEGVSGNFLFLDEKREDLLEELDIGEFAPCLYVLGAQGWDGLWDIEAAVRRVT